MLLSQVKSSKNTVTLPLTKRSLFALLFLASSNSITAEIIQSFLKLLFFSFEHLKKVESLV